MSRIDELVTNFWPELIDGTPDLASAFAADARVSYPPAEQSRGKAEIKSYLEATRRWVTSQRGRWEPLATTQAAARVVDEGVLVLQRPGGEVRLPVAIVADAGPDGIAWLRIYHSMWPLAGKHTVRPPLLRGQHDLPLSGAPAMYQESLARGDLEGVLASFAPDGCAREPSGGPYLYCGQEGLREFYGRLFVDGGIGLEHCTVTDDGVRCAIEYNAVRWGRTTLSPQAGVAVYERGQSGLLAAARIYDDVDPPPGK